jgi:hypothetical protein
MLKTKNTFFLILGFSLPLSVFISCKHTQYDVRGCGHFSSYEEVKDFGAFNVGTYWVYENQLTQERDTFTVYGFDLLYEVDKTTEIGFWTRMRRTYENAEWRYTYNINQDVIPLDEPCRLRRIWMNRVDFDSQGATNSIQTSTLLLPVNKGVPFYSLCGDETSELVTVKDVWVSDFLNYTNIETFSIVGRSFSLNGCTGEEYRYQFAQNIGLISWENLDAMDGKWELIAFERN